MNTYLHKIRTFIGSRYFFYFILTIFVVQALWLAFTSRYPMAFDENYHFEIIQAYARQWSPFFTSVPSGTESLGDITRYPSYLFHYLLSFVYRFVGLFTGSDVIQIMVLRVINIGLLASAFVLFKKLFNFTKMSSGASHVVLFIFAFVPIVPFLGAQISYDNASIPLTALTLLLLVKINDQFRRGVWPSQLLIWFVVVGIFSSLVKYTYLPIFVLCLTYAIGAFLYYQNKTKMKPLQETMLYFKSLSLLRFAGLVLLICFSLALFSERYMVNLYQYKTPVPDCAQVLSEESCMQYGPWGRDYQLKQRQQYETPNWKIKDYNKIWYQTMVYEFFYAIRHDYYHREPLPVLYIGSMWLFKIGLLLTVFTSWSLFKNRYLRLFAFVFVGYTAVVWLDNYLKFYSVHWPVAIHGRYLLPVLPLLLIIFAKSTIQSLNHLPLKDKSLHTVVALLIMLFAAWGGGVSTYIVRSDSSWYWQNKYVIRANQASQKILKPLFE